MGLGQVARSLEKRKVDPSTVILYFKISPVGIKYLNVRIKLKSLRRNVFIFIYLVVDETVRRKTQSPKR